MFSSGEDLLEFIKRNHRFDVVFLDILMKDMDGIEVGLTIRDKLCDEQTKLIYISTSKDFLMELFNVRITQFIVKPLDKNKVEKVLLKALRLIEQESELFTYKKNGTTHVVPIMDILYFESVGKKVKIVTMDGNKEFYGSLSYIIEKKYNNFIHVHRSYYVNFVYIKSYTSKAVTIRNGDIINIGSERKNDVRATLLRLTDQYSKGE